jgi:hypothetical protein
MTAPEPPATPEPRPTSEIIDQLLAQVRELERQHELDHGDNPGGQAFFVLEVHGVPQGVSGPYGQAEPETSPIPAIEEAEADLWNGPGWDTPLDTGPEAEAEWADEWDSADSAAYQTRAEAGLEPEAEAEAESGLELEP